MPGSSHGASCPLGQDDIIRGGKFDSRIALPRPRPDGRWRIRGSVGARPPGKSDPVLEQLFDLKGHGISVRTELLAGLTTFLTMACITFVNPAILATACMDFGAVFVAIL